MFSFKRKINSGIQNKYQLCPPNCPNLKAPLLILGNHTPILTPLSCLQVPSKDESSKARLPISYCPTEPALTCWAARKTQSIYSNKRSITLDFCLEVCIIYRNCVGKWPSPAFFFFTTSENFYTLELNVFLHHTAFLLCDVFKLLFNQLIRSFYAHKRLTADSSPRAACSTDIWWNTSFQKQLLF